MTSTDSKGPASASRGRPPVRPPPRGSVCRAGRPHRRLLAVLALALLLVGAVVARVGTLQTVDTPEYASYGQRQRTRTVPIPAERGVIFDRNGHELPLSVPKTTIWADPRLWQRLQRR